jgi:ParB-like chromosome segregation protein Spo0J
MPIPSNPILVNFHPLSKMFPLIEGEEFDELVADIRKYGLREPITPYEDMVLDGRNRFRACQAAGVAPIYATPFSGTHTDAAAFVISVNVRRRHLSPAQKRDLIDKFLELDPTKSSNQIAKVIGASHNTVEAVRKAKPNCQIDNKTDRTEASGRKARGRKPKPDRPRSMATTCRRPPTRASALPRSRKSNFAMSKRMPTSGPPHQTRHPRLVKSLSRLPSWTKPSPHSAP